MVFDPAATDHSAWPSALNMPQLVAFTWCSCVTVLERPQLEFRTKFGLSQATRSAAQACPRNENGTNLPQLVICHHHWPGLLHTCCSIRCHWHANFQSSHHDSFVLVAEGGAGVDGLADRLAAPLSIVVKVAE